MMGLYFSDIGSPLTSNLFDTSPIGACGESSFTMLQQVPSLIALFTAETPLSSLNLNFSKDSIVENYTQLP